MAQLRAEIRRQFGQSLASQPDFALVNPAAPEQSRILLGPLPEKAGGWGQIQPRWSDKDDPGYRKMLQRVGKAVGAD
jgi:hypothetical protein